MYNRACKLIFVVILLVLFVKFFGYPSYIKYSARKTLIVEEKVQFRSESPPAITISAGRRSEGSFSHGWKVDSSIYLPAGNIMETVCNKFDNINDTLACIEEKTFNFSDIIENANSGNIELNKAELWKREISYFWYGATLTLNGSYELGTQYSNALNININPTYIYYVWIHDPHFELGNNI